MAAGHNNSDHMYRLLVQGVTDYAIYMLEPDGTVANWNAGAERAKGYKAEEIVGRHFSCFYSADERAAGAPERGLKTALEQGRFEAEGWRIRKDGSRFWAHVVIDAIHDDDGNLVGLAKITRDCTEQRRVEKAAYDQERRFRLLVQGVTDYAIYMLEPDGTVANWNAGAERAKGYKAEEIVGRHFSCFYSADERAAGLPERGLKTALEQGRFEAEGWRMRKDGSRFWANVVIDAIHDDDGSLVGFAKITRDCTDRRQIENQILYLAHHDSLTGLPNRATFMERLAAVQGGPDADDCRILYIDLDRFKPVNDTLGHAAGDELLKAVGERLAAVVAKGDLVARLGGDEFAVLTTRGGDGAAISNLAERLIGELRRPFDVLGVQVVVGGSIGIAVAPLDGSTPDMLLRSADLALYRAKKEGRNCFRTYDPLMNATIVSRQLLELKLRHAIDAREFELNYQPIIDLKTDRAIGFEALLRWRQGDMVISPADFIPVAEEIGLMPEIGAWVLQTACRDAMAWPEKMTVAVNVSCTQFRDAGLLETVRDTLRATGLAPERLELEITETAMMENLDFALTTLNALRSMGVLIAMDDFGTGYSSLSFVQTFPFTRIKIDRSFVRDLGTKPQSMAIVRAVTGLCDGLGIDATAEGVETQEQRTILLREGCAAMQGFLVSKARPTAALGEFFPAQGAAKLRAG